MQKVLSIIAVMILTILLFAACSAAEPEAVPTPEITPAEPETTPSPEPTQASEVSLDGIYSKPLDLYSDVLNPLSELIKPDNYNPYKLDVIIGDSEGMFKLSYLTDDEDVAKFAASLLGYDSEDIITDLRQAVEDGDLCESGQLDETHEIEIVVRPAETESHYYNESAAYSVQLTTKIEPDMLSTYLQIIKQNINTKAFQMIEAQDLAEQFNLVTSGGITLVTGSVNYFNVSFDYKLNEAFDKWLEFFNSDAYFNRDSVSFWGEENVSLFNYGDLTTRVSLDPDNMRINFTQELPNVEQNISAYIPSQSLVTVGFDKMCNYNSEDGSIYVGIRKEIFGDIDEGDGTDFIQFSRDDGSYDCFLVKYFKPDGKYYVQVVNDGLKAEYYYDAFEDSYANSDGEKEVDEIKANMQTIMNSDADMVLGHPINTFEQYIIDTFGMNSDALFDLPKE